MTDTLYRSNKAVPDRVDRAWNAGYVAGTRAWRHVALVELLAGAWLLLRRRRTPMMAKVALFYGLLLACLVAVVVVPMVGMALGGRAIVRRWRAHRPIVVKPFDPDAF